MRLLATTLAALAATAALAGCFGYEEGQVRPGDRVVIEYTVTTLDGEVLFEDRRVTFDVLGGGSLLGAGVEARIVGLEPGDAFEETVTPRAGGVFHDPSELSTQSAIVTAPREALARELGVEASEFSVGQEIPLGFPVDHATVEMLDQNNVTIRLRIADGRAVDPVPEYGLTLVMAERGDELVQSVEPIEGTVISIPLLDERGQPVRETFGLEEGFYRWGAMEGELLTFHGGTLPTAIASPVVVHVTLTEVVPAPATGPVDDENYGRRIRA